MTTKYAELVEAEANAAEAEADEVEQAEADEAEQAEVEAEPEQPAAEAPPDALAAIGPAEIEKAQRSIASHRKRLATIMGADYVTHDCPMCSTLGFLPELPPAGTTFSFNLDEAGGLAMLVRPPLEDQYIQAPDKAACDWCDAFGLVRSGSRNPHAEVVPCTKCGGNGWVQVPADANVPPLVSVPDENGAPVNPEAVQSLGIDAWGRPAGHKHWGVPPAAIPG